MVAQCMRAHQSIRSAVQQAVWHCLASVQELHAPPYCTCGIIRCILADHHVSKQHPTQAELKELSGLHQNMLAQSAECRHQGWNLLGIRRRIDIKCL